MRISNFMQKIKNILTIFSVIFSLFAIPVFAQTYSLPSDYISYTIPETRFVSSYVGSVAHTDLVSDSPFNNFEATVTDNVGYVVVYDLYISPTLETFVDCSTQIDCPDFLNPTVAPLPHISRIFVFPPDSGSQSSVLACETGTYDSCFFDRQHTQIIDVQVLPNGPAFTVTILDDSSILSQASTQVSIGGDSFSPFIYAIGLLLFLAVIAFCMRYFKSKV